MSDPIIINRERYSDSLVQITMSDGTTLWGCSWPKCEFVSPNKESVPSHYKHHSGLAAQRRRGQKRPRSAEVTNEVMEAALALLDFAQDLVDKLDAFDAEFVNMRQQIAEHAIIDEGLREAAEVFRWKAERYDALMEMVAIAQQARDVETS